MISIEPLPQREQVRAPLPVAPNAPNQHHRQVPHWRRPLIVAGAAAVAAAIAIPVALAGSPTPGQGGHRQPGVSILARLADVAMAQPATVPPGPGQYQYTASVEANQACQVGTGQYCALVPEQRQIWIGADGSGRIRETFGAPEFLTSANEAAWKAAGSPPLGNGTSDTTFGPHALADGPGPLTKAPTNPAALKTAIENRSLEGGPPGPAEDFTQIGDLLRETDASPALRRAAFTVASELPGIVTLGNVTDHDGRSGIGMAMDSHGVRHELIFAPETSALMATETVALVDSPDGYSGVTAGTVLGWTVYTSSGIVNSLDATPTGTAPPAPPVTCTA
ncbi:MAG: CU044_5270 family protein, partial [Acidimicrobiales bacterium]